MLFLNKDNTAGKIVKPNDYVDNKPICIGFLIGASSLLVAGSLSLRMHVEQKDTGRKIAVGMDRVMAIAKARLGESNSLM